MLSPRLICCVIICTASQMRKTLTEQECIPVGWVPSAAVAVCQGECLLREGLTRGCLPEGVCLGVSAQGLSAQGVWTGVSAWGASAWGCPPDTPLWTEWQTAVKTLPGRNFIADDNKTTSALPVYWAGRLRTHVPLVENTIYTHYFHVTLCTSRNDTHDFLHKR